MYKIKINYTDYDGNNRAEDFYFNLNKAELVELNYSMKGGMQEWLEEIVRTDDNQKMVELLKNLITLSYGRKSADGKRFIKSKEETEEFLQSEAYSDLFMRLATNEKEMTAFINGIVPAGMAAEVAAANNNV